MQHLSLPPNVPKRGGGVLIKKIASYINQLTGWKAVGSLPNISQAVLIGVPHTSNFDGVFVLPLLIEMDIQLTILAKKQLFYVPILANFLRKMGAVPIDRDKKGSVLGANIERFASKRPLFLALAPEGTRSYTNSWKTGFYYLALNAQVPIIPVAIDYGKKQIHFMSPFYPSGDIEHDLPKIYQYYQGVVAKYPKNVSKPLQDLMS